MARKYNLGSKSDMRRFERELKKSVMDQAKTSIMRGTHKVTCPHCGHNLNAHIGSSFSIALSISESFTLILRLTVLSMSSSFTISLV